MKNKYWALLVVALIVFAVFYTAPGELVQRRPYDERGCASIVFYFIGAMFLLGYFYEEKSFVFKIPMWICMNLTWPSSRKWALVYCAAFWVSGTIMLLETL